MNYCAARAWIRNFKEADENGTVPDAQNGFIIKQMVDMITVCDKYMQIKFKCGVTFARQYVE